jgi:NTE family protein
MDPVRELQPILDVSEEKPKEALGLCLSGGGYRAMLFHVGALWRLNEVRLLRELNRISGVSGGSITAATLGLHWDGLNWHEGVATNLDELLVRPVRGLAGETIDVSSVVEGILPFTTVGRRVAHAYREHLFGEATLQDLPDDAPPQGQRGPEPRFIICATNLESGVLFRFSRAYAADYRVGTINKPEIPLADAVAASSAFPPVLSPFEIDLRAAEWETVPGNDLVEPEWRGEIKLSDGGVYDNLGLETIWKRCETVLISDGGGQVPDDPDPPADWPRQSLRVLKVIDNQVRALRKRQAVASYKLQLRKGAYWGIRSQVADYELGDALDADADLTSALAETPTRLRKLGDRHQDRLINWGYIICDTAVRKWVKDGLTPPDTLPYPESGLG